MSSDIILPDTEIVHPVGVPFKKTVVYKADMDVKEGERAVIAAISTDTIDRDSEIVLPRGIDRTHFLKNPVVLWAHDYRQLPIGRCMWLKLAGNGKEIIAKTQFNKTALGDQVFKLYQERHLNAFSIGFMVNDWYVPTEKDRLENPDLEKCRAVIRKCSLLEYSAVPVPSNPTALAREVSKGLSIPEDVRKFIEKEIIAVNVPIDTDRWSEPPAEDHGEDVKGVEEAEDLTEKEVTDEVVTKELVEPTDEITPEVVVEVEKEVVAEVVKEAENEFISVEACIAKIADALVAKLGIQPTVIETPEVVEVKNVTGVVEFKGCEFVKSTWDAKESLARVKSYASEDESGNSDSIDFDVYAQSFAWFNPQNIKSTASYKFLHHDLIDGKLVVSRDAVESCLKNLDSVNSPVPKEYRDQVREHLESHKKSWADEVQPEAVIVPHRTLKSLADSLKKRLDQMPIDKIIQKTVVDIAKDRVDYHDGRV